MRGLKRVPNQKQSCRHTIGYVTMCRCDLVHWNSDYSGGMISRLLVFTTE
jgi:hypothetical protein